MILVAGGSGFIGAAAVRRLVADGEDVLVMTAHPSRSGRRIAALGARAVGGDVLDEASLAPALSGADVVVQALTFPTFPVQRPRRGYTFEAFDGRGTSRLVDAAVAVGARKFVFVSGVGASADASQAWYRAKWEGEEHLRRAAIDHVILRPSWVYGPEDRALNVFVWCSRFLPAIPVVGDGSQALQPVFVEDVARAIAQAARPGGLSGTFEIGGPDVLSMNEVLRTMLAVRGARRALLHIPRWMAKAGGAVAQLWPWPKLSPEAVEFLTEDAVADTEALRGHFDLDLTPFRVGLATYLAKGARRPGP
ncbi:MAG: complex I NDUFA9 subunit family protein [Actinobacteria bacterium]|nr:MAG: complex I NDUFA9 subunit family protein [Actinomycetota bacterium]